MTLCSFFFSFKVRKTSDSPLEKSALQIAGELDLVSRMTFLSLCFRQQRENLCLHV